MAWPEGVRTFKLLFDVVGGCAGCVVEVQEESGPEMRRVCVDGPVFDGYSVFS